MAAPRKATRDIEKDYPRHHFTAKLRRLADCLEQGKPFRIQIARASTRRAVAIARHGPCVEA